MMRAWLSYNDRCRRTAFQIVLFCGAALAAAFITGCSGGSFASLRPGLEARGHYIEGVPFYRQSDSRCGPAALADVFSYWGSPSNPDLIAVNVYLPELGGTLPTDMENFSREWGFDVVAFSGELRDMKAFVRQGIPVICMLDLGFGVYRRPHYITVIGYDDMKTVIIAHDGVKPNTVMGYEKFNAAWTRAGNWMLAIMPKAGGT